MQFTVTHKNGIWCELLLRAVPLYSTFTNIWTDIYTVTLLPCPRGFLLHSEGYCWCDPILSSYIPSIIHCNIDNQTIPHPAILPTTHTPTLCPYIVHLTTAYLTHHTSTSPLLTLNVSLTDLVYCVDNVNKVSVLSLVPLSVNNALMFIY